MQGWVDWLTQSGFESILILLLVVLLERVINWPDSYHPLTLFRLLATLLAKKVNPSAARSQLQRRISGSLAAIILILPTIVILGALLYLSVYPQFFNALLLLIALQFSPVVGQFKRVQNAIQHEKKILARQQLSPLVLRQTDLLSPMGLAKAAVESLVLRYCYQYLSIMFWYLLTGGLGALIVRLCFELSQTWNTKIRHNTYFGAPVSFINQILQWLPTRIFLIMFITAQGIGNAVKAFKQRPQNQPYHLIKVIVGGALGFQLGGPAFYQDQKRRYPKLGGLREIRFMDMQRTLRALASTTAIFLVLTILFAALFNYMSLQSWWGH